MPGERPHQDESARAGERRRANADAGRLRAWLAPLLTTLGVHGLVALAIGTLAIGAIVLRPKGTQAPVVLYGEVDASTRAPHDPDRVAPEPSSDAERATNPTAQNSERLGDVRDRLRGSDDARSVRERLAQSGTQTPTLGQGGNATFAGLRVVQAGSIVYVVDASGSMIGTLPVVLDELERSLGTLGPTQRCALLFFQRNRPVAPPDLRLLPAGPETTRTLMDWARATIRPAGRSNPLAALEQALALRPEVVFLLSTAITGSGEFDMSRDEILAALDRLNPIDPRTGRRPTRIQCVQFLDPDPTGTLEAIAARHGGADGFRFLSREALGLGVRGTPP